MSSEPNQPIRSTIPLDSLIPGDSPRLQGVDASHAEALAQIDQKLPPILVQRSRMKVIDGMHRLHAARLRGHREIEVEFFEGDDESAYILAVESNVMHGLPLTLAERRSAATRILACRPGWSDRAIAKVTGLSAATVAKIRQREAAGPGSTPARIGRDGRVRPIEAASGRRRAAEFITERPHASLREIAQAAGISPATARDVRRRLNLNEDAAPSNSHTVGKVERRSAVPRPTAIRSKAVPPPAEIVERLRRDPSIRLNAERRALLTWLTTNTDGITVWSQYIDCVPPHSIPLIVDLARSCALTWNKFADELERRRH